MKILHLRASPFLGSPERLLLNQIKHFGSRPFCYIVGVFNEQPGGKNDFLESVKGLGAKGYALHPNMLFCVFTLIRLCRLARYEGVDLIFGHDFKSDFFALIMSSILGIPCVAVFHGRTSQGAKLRFYEKFDDHLLPYFKRVVAVSNDIKLKLGGIGIEEEKIRVIPNGIDIIHESDADRQNSVRAELGISDRDPLILYAGRLSKEKGLHVLIDAAPEVLRSARDAKFVVLGQGPEANSLKAQVESLGMLKSFAFLGFQNDIQSFLREMDLCVLPSFTEGMPLVILEAFANQKPVVASGVGGITELVQDGVTGILVEPGNPAELARGIIRLLDNRELARGMGKAGLELVRTQYSVERQLEGYCEIFTEIGQDTR